MSEQPAQVIRVTCPFCKNQFTASIQNVVDVGQHPELKTILLQGRLNVVTCPHCGRNGMLNVPLVYHDPAKELLFVLTPNNLNLTGDVQQRLIGDLSNAVMHSLPPAQRKAYLLQPTVFLSLESMLEAILQADGITPDMLEAQRSRARLVDELLTVDDDVELAKRVAEHDAEIDYDFFSLLIMAIRSAEAAGQAGVVARLSALYNKLLELSSTGQSIQAQREALESLGEEVTREELLEKIITAHDDGVVGALVATLRPLVDYQFFKMLSARIEAADDEEAERLKQLRSKILEITRELDEETRELFEEASSLLREILLSEDREQEVRDNLDRIDDLFMSVLEANIQSAEEAGEVEAAEDMASLRELIFDIVEEGIPAPIRFINQLLRADYPGGTQALLQENAAQVNDELLAIMEALGQNLEDSGREELSQRLGAIRQQAVALLG